MTYKTTIGIEVHAELKTESKIFSDSKNNYGSRANTNASLVDLAYPGTLPLLNEKVIDLALRAALVLNCQVNKRMHFDRKNYFYPDLAKGYQNTQNRTPIGTGGYIDIDLNGSAKRIRITDVHIEEDTAKSIHRADKSLLDFNRAGVPLIEIVSEADMNSPEEAVAYLTKLRELLLYADISDVKIEEGSMRCDANVSISKTSDLGTRTEIKNIGSITNVGLAIEVEAKRQEDILESGETIFEETRKYDADTNTTILLRLKEQGNDYRYFPEANIPYLELTDEYIAKVKEALPLPADARRDIYRKEKILDINIEKLINNRSMSDYLDKFLEKDIDILLASNLILGDLAAYCNKVSKPIDEIGLSDDKFVELVSLYSKRQINSKIIKDLLDEIITSDKKIIDILNDKNLILSDDDDLIDNLVTKVINDNEESVKDYLSGNSRAIKHLMGMLMKESKGQVKPDVASTKLNQRLEEMK